MAVKQGKRSAPLIPGLLLSCTSDTGGFLSPENRVPGSRSCDSSRRPPKRRKDARPQSRNDRGLGLENRTTRFRGLTEKACTLLSPTLFGSCVLPPRVTDSTESIFLACSSFRSDSIGEITLLLKGGCWLAKAGQRRKNSTLFSQTKKLPSVSMALSGFFAPDWGDGLSDRVLNPNPGKVRTSHSPNKEKKP